MITGWYAHAKVLIVLAVGILICGCNFHLGNIKLGETRLGMVGSKSPRSMIYSYHTFSGYESQDFQAGAGETLEISYRAVVDRGNLTLEVQDPHRNVIWTRSMEKTVEDGIQLDLDKTGRYGIIIQAKDTAGSFEINWMVKSIDG
ncbi:MAG: hypothetical protein IBX69_18320 [Anaerolineales bacterium]|nr:hypothetical protein [Anaerolineales bacterium]